MSGTNVIEGDDEVITRRSRADRPAREVHREPEPPEVVVEEGSRVSPEDALAEAHRQLAESDARTAAARKAQREADSRARAAEAAAAQAAAGRTTDRVGVVDANLSAAREAQANARTAYRLAKEAGDIDAEIAASEALATATQRLNTADAEKEWLKNNAPKQAPAQATGMSDAAKRWVDDHPAYYSDRKYQATAHIAHEEAIRAGQREGSQEYVDFIDRVLTEEYGDGHGQTDSGDRRVTQPNRAAPSRQSSAAPPSRGSGGGNGYKSVKIPRLGEIQYRDQAGGGRSIKIPDPAMRAAFEEYATLAHMSLSDYANDQVEHALEVAAGGRGDLIMGEGSRYE